MCVVRFSVVVVMLAATACSRDRRYELHGQVLATDPARREITLKHDAIPGFMPGMTMPFKVRDDRLLRGREPGDLVTATLVVEERDAYLSSITKKGHAALTEAPPPRPTILQAGDSLPDVSLTDHSGRGRRLSDWRGRTLAVTFMYTRCPMPEFCPLMDRRFAEVQHALQTDASLAGKTHLLSVSLDPVYDTPAVLMSHADRVGAVSAHWTFATGERSEIERLASSFGVSISRPASGADGEIVHNLRTAVVNGDGRIVTLLSGDEWTSEQLLNHLRAARR